MACAPAQEAATSECVALPQLLDPKYQPTTLLSTFAPRASGQPTFPALEDWVEMFRGSAAPGGSVRRAAEADASLPEAERVRAAQRFGDAYIAMLNEIEQQALQSSSSGSGGGGGDDSGGSNGSAARPLGCVELCALRERALLAAGFTDAFRAIKARENEAALGLLRDVCAELDVHGEPRDRWEAIVRGVFAGNIFDLGCQATSDMYHDEGGVAFHATRDKLLPRPWVIDDLDALLDRLTTHRYRKAVLFVDNSGADVVLGMLPLARELLRRGTVVIVAANEHPSINDITAAELDALLPQVSAADPVLCKGIATRQLQVVSSGSGLPVLDLSQVSRELAAAAGDADLVVLEGMGRSIETNLHARLSCDQLNLGMIKHPEVAAALGGRLYDCVCQFRPAA